MEEQGREIKYVDCMYLNPPWKRYTAFDYVVCGLLEAKKRGEHVYVKCLSLKDGKEEDIILDSNDINTVDDAYMLVYGRSLAEDIEKEKKWYEEFHKKEQDRKEQYDKWVNDNFDMIVNSAHDFFEGDSLKIQKWIELCNKCKENSFSFSLIFDVYKILSALKTGIESAIKVLADMNPRMSGGSYSSIRRIVCQFSNDGRQLYEKYENMNKISSK